MFGLWWEAKYKNGLLIQILTSLVCLVEIAWSAVLKILKCGLCWYGPFGTLWLNITLKIPNSSKSWIWLKSCCKIIRKQTGFLCPCPAGANCRWKSKESIHILYVLTSWWFIFCVDAYTCLNLSCTYSLSLIKLSIFYH